MKFKPRHLHATAGILAFVFSLSCASKGDFWLAGLLGLMTVASILNILHDRSMESRWAKEDRDGC